MGTIESIFMYFVTSFKPCGMICGRSKKVKILKTMIEDGLESYDTDFNLPNLIKDLKKRKVDNVQ